MRALPIVMGLLVLPPPALAAGADDLAALFLDACMGTESATEAVDALGEARGWSRDRTRSGEQSRMASQSITGSTWIVAAGRTSGGSPEREVSAIRIVDRPDTAGRSAELCSVSQRDFRSHRLAGRLQQTLHLADPTRRASGADLATTQWTLSAEPLDAIVLSEGQVRAGPVTTITRARISTQEKR